MKLGEVLKKWRRMTETSIRDAAKEMGVNISTLSRIENGECMDGRTLARILAWLTAEVKRA